MGTATIHGAMTTTSHRPTRLVGDVNALTRTAPRNDTAAAATHAARQA